MDLREYEIVKNFSYEEYCDYLSKKYESVDKTGLFKHHTFENVKANLSKPDITKDAAEYINRSVSAVTRAIKEGSICGGYHWEYVE